MIVRADELKAQQESIQDGNTKPLESILLIQVQTLHVLFNRALEKIAESDNPALLQTFSDIAFKANNAFRKNILALHHIKNPSGSTFIRQQNNATIQQVNNNPQQENLENPANELLSTKEKELETLDTTGTASSIHPDSEMETVEICRGKNSRRESD